MRRRDFVAGTIASVLFASRAGAKDIPTVGYLSSKSEAAERGIVAGVKRGLALVGLHDAEDLLIVYRWSGGNYGELARMAAELVSSQVDIIASSGLPATLAAQKATAAIPIVFRLAVDPIAFGLARSFDRPGTNLTGVTMLFDPLTPKKLQLLQELVPSRSVALLVNPKNPNAASHREHAETAARSLGLRLLVVAASAAAEVGPAFVSARQGEAGAVLVGDDPLFDSESDKLVQAAAAQRLPTMFYVRDFVRAGGLISYGPNFDEMAEQVGQDIGRILKGAKPADIPIQQPTKFELVVNARTAKALDLAIPNSLLDRSDEVIE